MSLGSNTCLAVDVCDVVNMLIKPRCSAPAWPSRRPSITNKFDYQPWYAHNNALSFLEQTYLYSYTSS